jgi:uncharacterized damage-inducible protein DinB
MDAFRQSTSTVTNSDGLAGSEVSRAFIQCAREFLKNDYLPKIERCLEQLTDEQVWWRANPESNSIGNLLLHLCGNARQWIVSGLGGETDRRVRQREFDERTMISRSELLSRLRETLAEVDSVLANFDCERILDQHRIQESAVTALEAIFHVIEHFSMHTGQIIVLTKMLTKEELNFYDFSTGGPLQTWHEPQQ